ncbi:MAG: penicillin acylase family protein [Desulfobacter sp.]|nr:penicillin acylase family protein [Desulfobacter sp.]
MKQLAKVLFFFILFVFGLGILATGGAWIYLDHLQPKIQGSLNIAKITQQTAIVRDQWGVPHITAQNGKDAYFALGLTLAQDRLFQMELQRRLAKGELAEILGPKLVDVDKKFRTLMLKHRAQDYLEKEDLINAEALAFLEGMFRILCHGFGSRICLSASGSKSQVREWAFNQPRRRS